LIHDRDLNKVVKVFSIIVISFVPQTFIPCLFAINVTVPMQNADSLAPFFGIVIFTFGLSLISFCY